MPSMMDHARAYIAAHIDDICYELYCNETDGVPDVALSSFNEALSAAVGRPADQASSFLAYYRWGTVERMVREAMPEPLAHGRQVYEQRQAEAERLRSGSMAFAERMSRPTCTPACEEPRPPR